MADKKTEEQLAAEKAAADKAAAEKAAADAAADAAAAKPAQKRPDFVVAPDQAVITHMGVVVDAGGEVKPTDFHVESGKSKANFDDLVRRGAIVKGS